MALTPRIALAALMALACALACLLPGVARAAEPAVVYEAVQFDDSFNVAANDGIERYKKEFGPARQAFGMRAIEALAQAGHDPVIAIGFALANELARVAKLHPRVHFTIVDAVVEAPNVQSIVFKENEGAFLVGLLAGMASRSGTVGFIGGMDIPVIRNFQCGYEQGVRQSGGASHVLVAMAGNSAAAFNDPERGAALADEQFTRGADVIFAAAGGTGRGVYRAAQQRGKLAIGVDRNQNGLYPGTLLSSMVKRIDTAVYLAAREGRSGKPRAALLSLGLKEQGVSWALDRHNRALVSDAMQARVEAAARAVIAGQQQVQGHVQGQGCAR